MEDLESKKKVLEEIMALMDEKEGEMLKKHPKIAGVKAEVIEPSLEEEVSADEPDLSASGSAIESKDDLDPETVQKLLEMYNEIK